MPDPVASRPVPFAAVLLGLAAWTLASGCGPGNDAPIPGASRGPQREDDGRAEPVAAAFSPDGPAWAVPVPPAKAPVHVSDYEPLADDDGPGDDALRRADRLKSAGRYADARAAYEEALAADPDLARAAYQLACNEALAGDPAAARAAFDRAMAIGFTEYPVARSDDELGVLRTAPDFPDRLRELRRRYLDAAAGEVGTPFFVAPADVNARPLDGDEGPPVILLLHGYGDSHENYLGEAVGWAELGWAAVAVPGSVPAGGGSFVWPKGDEIYEAAGGGENGNGEDAAYATVDRQLRVILADPGLNAVADARRAFLLGFSQGANYAAELTSRHPGTYAGAVALSPGGLPEGVYRTPNLAPSAPRPVAIFYGDREDGAEMLAMWSAACRSAGWPVLADRFPGGHQFPSDWRGDETGAGSRRAGTAAFLLNPAAN